jgi:transcriptional regulator with PAS, ATPase and Fis domain
MRGIQKASMQGLLISDMFFVQSFCEALGQASLGIIIVDKKNVIQVFNDKAGNLLGVKPSLSVGKKINEIVPDKNALLSPSSFSKFNEEELIINEKRLICNTIPIKIGDTSTATAKILWDLSELMLLESELKGIPAKNRFFGSSDAIRNNNLDEAKTHLVASGSVKKTKLCMFSFDDIIGKSKIMRDLKKRAHRIAQGDSTVHITGETGTGKELFAQAIHAASLRRNAPFVRINCGSIPDTLLESELFGYEPGSFTGAAKKGKRGKFEIGHNGTVFLDESGDMSLSMQAKLLRVIQEGEFERVGGIAIYELDVRIIAATNKDLWKMVTDGEFREDLYYRLDVVNLHIPPLRDRLEDIPILVNSFLPIVNLRVKRQAKAVSDEVLDYFQSYDWPGNVRELKNVLESMVNLDYGEVLGIEALPLRIRRKAGDLCLPAEHNGAKAQFFTEVKEWNERAMIIQALSLKGGNKRQAAIYLNMPRSTFYNKLKKYKIKDGDELVR